MARENGSAQVYSKGMRIVDASAFVVEQVIISVVPGVEQNAVRLVCATDGVARDEIAVVLDYASRVELFDGEFDAKNLFGFLLPSDYSAIGRLTPAAGAARKKEFYFQCLIVKPETFFQTGANPTALVHLAINTMCFALYSPKTQLSSFELCEHFACVKQDDLKYATKGIGVKALATLVQAIVENRRVFFVSSYNAYLLLGSVFSLLPIHARRALSFSIGLTFRDEHETRLVGATVSASKVFQQSYAAEFDYFLDVRDVTKNESEYVLENPWALFVEKTLNKDSLDSFYCKIVKESLEYPNRVFSPTFEPNMSMEEVSALGEKWLQSADSLFESGDAVESSFDGEEDGEFDEDSDDAFALETPWNQEESKRDGEDWKNNSEWVNDYGDSREIDNVLPTRSQPFEPEDKTRFDDAKEASEIYDKEGENVEGPLPLKKESARSFFEMARAIITEVDKRSTNDSDSRTQESKQKRLTALEQEELNALVKRFFKPSSKKVAELLDDDLDGRENREGPVVQGLSLSPFAVLSAEFPEQNEILRTLDALITQTCNRGANAKDSLVDFWNEFVDSQSENVVERVREAYLNRLRQVTRMRETEETSATVDRIWGAFDVFDVLMN